MLCKQPMPNSSPWDQCQINTNLTTLGTRVSNPLGRYCKMIHCSLGDAICIHPITYQLYRYVCLWIYCFFNYDIQYLCDLRVHFAIHYNIWVWCALFCSIYPYHSGLLHSLYHCLGATELWKKPPLQKRCVGNDFSYNIKARNSFKL